jgi:acyl-coenzyme A thioesterase PaaI-like protein
MSQVTIDELNKLIQEDIPSIGETGVVFETLGDGLATARLPFHSSTLRPGGTISGPTMMGPADIVCSCMCLIKNWDGERCGYNGPQ